MSIVSIIGASELGGALTHKLAIRDRIDEIRLIDPTIGVAAGKTLDIQQAGPIEGFRTRLVSSTDLRTVQGSTVISLTGFATPSATVIQDQRTRSLLEQLINFEKDAVMVCAGASDRQTIETGLREIKIPRTKLVGSAPSALTSAVRSMIAVEVGKSPSDVSVGVLGIPPANTVILWSEATIGNQNLMQVMEPKTLARLKAQAARLWPPGPFSLASAASRICEAVATGDSDRAYSCFIGLDGEMGARDVVTTMTVLLHRWGVNQIVIPSLSAYENVQHQNALEAG